MPYDCVIATKNRIDALRMSIPLIIKQDILPKRLIVVDASDDHSAVETAVSEICRRHRYGNFIVVKSDAANLARQRNIALQFVEAPVVMFPDDDSMWFRGFASRVLQIYEADSRRQVGGVTGFAVLAPPPEMEQPTYKTSRLAVVKAALQPMRNRIENLAFPKPFDLIAQRTWTRDIDVVDNVNSKRVATVGGFRMSFRTDIVKSQGFDEALGYSVGYCQHEDMDVSLRIQRSGYALVSAENAKVFHYMFPGKRAKGYNYGFCWIANYVYTCKRNIGEDIDIYRSLERFLAYKLSGYATQLHSEYGRQVFAGARDAWRERFRLMNSSQAALSDAYKALCEQYIKKQSIPDSAQHGSRVLGSLPTP